MESSAQVKTCPKIGKGTLSLKQKATEVGRLGGGKIMLFSDCFLSEIRSKIIH